MRAEVSTEDLVFICLRTDCTTDISNQKRIIWYTREFMDIHTRNWLWWHSFYIFSLECGNPAIKNSRIVGGDGAVPHSWPWQILLYKYKDGRHRAMCGGSLLNPKFIVTAAHCVYDHKNRLHLFRVRWGFHLCTPRNI